MGDWSSVTEDRDNCPTRDLRFSSTEDMSSVTGDIAPFNGDVDFVYIFCGTDNSFNYLICSLQSENVLFCHENCYISNLMKIHMKKCENRKKENKNLGSLFFLV